MTTATRMPVKPSPQRAAIPTLGTPPKREIKPKFILNAVEGWGKTTTAAYAPGVAVLMARGEAGYETLLSASRVPEVPRVTLERWDGLLAMLDAWEYPNVQWLALDALSGFERLCHEHVCHRDFNDDWGEKGFGAFQKGFDVSVAEWLKLLQKLERLNMEKGVGIILLSHSKVRPFRNPMGPDFDRYIADCHEKTWGVTAKWADAVLFGTFMTVTEQDRQSKKFKGTGGTSRVVYTQRTDAYDAKNRYGMEPAIGLPEDYTAMWATIAAAFSGAPAPVSEIPE